MKAILDRLGIREINDGVCTGPDSWFGDGETLVSTNPSSNETIASVRQATPDSYETVRELEKDSPTGLVLVGLAHAAAGRSSEARATRDQLERLAGRQYVSPVHLATLSAYLDDREDAFRWMEKAFDDGATDLRFLKVDPLFDPMRSDPRFPDLLRRMNLPE